MLHVSSSNDTLTAHSAVTYKEQLVFNTSRGRLDTAFTSHPGEDYNPCSLLLFDSRKEDFLETM